MAMSIVRALGRQHGAKSMAAVVSTQTSAPTVASFVPKRELAYKSPHKQISPHVTIYKFPIAAITSGSNRFLGGVGLWIGA